MQNIMMGLFCLMVLCVIVGMVKPRLVVFWGEEAKKTRLTVLKVYVILCFLSLFGVGMFNETPSTKPVSSDKAAETTTAPESSSKNTKALEGPCSGEENPYKDDKDAPLDSDQYKFWYINEYITGKYNDKRQQLWVSLTVHSQLIPVKNAGRHGIVEMTRNGNGIYYRGEMKDNVPQGMGMVFAIKELSGTKYLVPLFGGEFNDGLLEGYGRFYDYLEVDAQKIAKLCKEQKNDDREWAQKHMAWLSYEGTVKRGKARGEGIRYMRLAQGDIELNRMKKTEDKDISISIGQFDGENPDGLIRVYTKKKLSFEGTAGKTGMEGKGTVYYPSGAIRYEGEFSHNKFNGKGTLYREDGSIEYKGKWKDGDYSS